MTTKENLMSMIDAAVDDISIEELMLDTEPVAEPGDRAGHIEAKPSADFPAATMINDLESAGWVKVWDNRTGEESIINKNMLPDQLKKKRDDGTRVFTTRNPGITPARGSLVCMLHESFSERPYFDTLGLPVCRKSNLKTQMDVRLHMERRHTSAWKILEENRRNKTEQEESAVRHATLAMLSRNQPERTPVISGVERTCEKCGEGLTAKTAGGMNLVLARHKKTCKG